MAFIFPSSVGWPVVITDPHAQPVTFAFSLGGWPGFAGSLCVLQGVTASSRGNYQFLYTIGDFTYVYVFGELMGDMAVTGLAMPGACPATAYHGLSSAVDYYNSYAISTTGTPVQVNFAGLGLLAFIVGGNFVMKNQESGIGQFQLDLKIISS